MKLSLPLALLGLLASVSASRAAPLEEASLAPAWMSATQAEKDQWITSFKFEDKKADKAGIAACLDKMAPRPPFETNKLSDVTSMCETIVARGGM